jgi:OFA family oxalate/formate antiporter-like MFS transporter
MVVRYDPRIIIACSSSIGLAGVFFSSFMQNFWAFFFCYSFPLGVMLGTGYIVPVHLCWDWFPNNKGLATGIVLGGFGAGAFIFGFISRWLVNPSGLPLNPANGRFYTSVTDRVPFMLRTLAMIWAGLVIVSLFMIKPAPSDGTHHDLKKPLGDKTIINEESDPNDLRQQLLDEKSKKAAQEAEERGEIIQSPLRQCFTSKQFILVYTMMLLSVFLGFYVAGVYKLYGNSVLKDDAFMTMVGSVAFTIGALRFVWSWLVDKYSYKFSYTIILVLQTGLALSMVTIAPIKILYFIWVCILIWLEGGHFVLLPTVIAKLFPDYRAYVYGVAFSLNGMANLLAVILIRFTLTLVGGFGFYLYVGGIFSGIALILLLCFFEETPVVIKKSTKAN